MKNAKSAVVQGPKGTENWSHKGVGYKVANFTGKCQSQTQKPSRPAETYPMIIKIIPVHHHPFFK